VRVAFCKKSTICKTVWVEKGLGEIEIKFSCVFSLVPVLMQSWLRISPLLFNVRLIKAAVSLLILTTGE
jgi:hypothetical protein